ncbi:MAG: hypothetical protein WDW38_006149 [Sanguina aurantia]
MNRKSTGVQKPSIVGEREVPEHPLVRQTMHDCLREAMDTDGWLDVLRAMESGAIRIVARDLTGPSPLAAEVLNAAPYAFLDDAPLEERRTHAVQSRQWNGADGADDLGRLDPEAIAAVRGEAWPQVRDADEMHEALNVLGFVTAAEVAADDRWPAWLLALASSRRAAQLRIPAPAAEATVLWTCAEKLPLWQAVHPQAALHPAITAPVPYAAQSWTRDDALLELVRHRLGGLGPVTVATLAQSLAVEPGDVDAVLARLQSEGYVMQGQFTAGASTHEWCERHLLARIHRYTLGRLRREIEPVSRRELMQFLFDWQHVSDDAKLSGPDALPAVLGQLEGFEAAAGAWESEILPARLADYSISWLDDLCRAGRISWLRLRSGSGGGGGPVRSTPIVLLPRRSMAVWTSIACHADTDEISLSSRAQAVADVLSTNGALFFDELMREAPPLLQASNVPGASPTSTTSSPRKPRAPIVPTSTPSTSRAAAPHQQPCTNRRGPSRCTLAALPHGGSAAALVGVSPRCPPAAGQPLLAQPPLAELHPPALQSPGPLPTAVHTTLVHRVKTAPDPLASAHTQRMTGAPGSVKPSCAPSTAAPSSRAPKRQQARGAALPPVRNSSGSKGPGPLGCPPVHQTAAAAAVPAEASQPPEACPHPTHCSTPIDRAVPSFRQAPSAGIDSPSAGSESMEWRARASQRDMDIDPPSSAPSHHGSGPTSNLGVKLKAGPPGSISFPVGPAAGQPPAQHPRLWEWPARAEAGIIWPVAVGTGQAQRQHDPQQGP